MQFILRLIRFILLAKGTSRTFLRRKVPKELHRKRITKNPLRFAKRKELSRFAPSNSFSFLTIHSLDFFNVILLKVREGSYRFLIQPQNHVARFHFVSLYSVRFFNIIISVFSNPASNANFSMNVLCRRCSSGGPKSSVL